MYIFASEYGSLNIHFINLNTLKGALKPPALIGHIAKRTKIKIAANGNGCIFNRIIIEIMALISFQDRNC